MRKTLPIKESATACNERWYFLLQEKKIHICTLDRVRFNDYTKYINFRRSDMFEYMTAQEEADKWNVSLVLRMERVNFEKYINY